MTWEQVHAHAANERAQEGVWGFQEEFARLGVAKGQSATIVKGTGRKPRYYEETIETRLVVLRRTITFTQG